MDCNTKQRQSGCPSCSGQKSHRGRTSIPDIPVGPPPMTWSDMTWPDMPMMEPVPETCPMRGKRGSAPMMPPELPRENAERMMRPDMMRRPSVQPIMPVKPGCSDMVRPSMPSMYPDMLRPEMPSACPDMVRPTMPQVCPDMVRPTMPQVCPDMVRPTMPSTCPDMVRPPAPPIFPEMPQVMPGGMNTGNCMRNQPSNVSEVREPFPVGMAYVPWQQWQELYSLEQGFDRGTIFPDLDFPFLMGRCW